MDTSVTANGRLSVLMYNPSRKDCVFGTSDNGVNY